MSPLTNKFRQVWYAFHICMFSSLFLFYPRYVQSMEIIVSFQDSQPKYLIENGSLSGLCFDIYKGIENHLSDLDITFKYPSYYTPLKRIFSEMEKGKTHLYCGAGRNNKRTKNLIYSDIPLYEVKNLIASRAQDKDTANSLQDLVADKSPVMALLGTSTERFLRKNNVSIEHISPTSATHALTLIHRKRARYFVYHDIGLHYHIKQNFDKQDFKFGSSPVRRYNHWMVFSQHLSSEAITKINHAIRYMQKSEEISGMMRKYQ